MNKYKIDVHYLRNKITEYKQLSQKIDINNMSDRDFEVIDITNNYQFILDNYNFKKTLCISKDKDSESEDDLTDLEIIDDTFWMDMDSLDTDIDGYMAILYKYFQEFESDETIILDRIRFDNDQLLEFMDTIVRKVGHKKFISYYEKVQKIIWYHIQYYDKNFQLTGNCLYNSIDFHFYHFLVRENSALDILTAVHEMFHAIILYYLAEADKSCYAYKSAYIKELEGFFADMLVTDQLMTLFPHSLNLLKCDVQDILWCSKAMMVGMAASKRLDKNGMINLEKVNQTLLKSGISNPKVTRENIYDFIDTRFIDNSTYCCSFLCACDLFQLYQSDQEKAIDELLKITNLTPGDLSNNLRRHGITFMDDNFANFRNLNNKLLQKKKS